MLLLFYYYVYFVFKVNMEEEKVVKLRERGKVNFNDIVWVFNLVEFEVIKYCC